jgi:hypothetical protein
MTSRYDVTIMTSLYDVTIMTSLYDVMIMTSLYDVTIMTSLYDVTIMTSLYDGHNNDVYCPVVRITDTLALLSVHNVFSTVNFFSKILRFPCKPVYSSECFKIR